jgi:hypothetical protein
MFPCRRLLPQMAVAVSILSAGTLGAQSGRGSMHGYVGFDDISYVEQAEGHIHAAVELRGATAHNQEVYTASTDNRGSYDIPAIGAGQYTLTITAPRHMTYRIDVYIPSDFECRLATMLKRRPGGRKE